MKITSAFTVALFVFFSFVSKAQNTEITKSKTTWLMADLLKNKSTEVLGEPEIVASPYGE